MATASETKVIEAYIGLLGRAPDPSGLAYWTAQLDAAGGTTDALKKLTNDITLSSEWDAKGYGTSTTVDGVTTVTFTKAEADTVVNDMYANLFEKEGAAAPSAADVKYWSDQIQDGTVTASEMAVLLIAGAGTTDAATLAFKTEAATYYSENVVQADFNRTDAGSAVADVAGPQSLATSKAATDKISTGEGNTTVLTTAADTVTMSGGDDVVTGTIGLGATYGAEDILDTSTTDSDTVTITGDTDFTFGNITNVEAVNVNLSNQLGAGFTITDADKVTKSTINFSVDKTVDIAGVTVTGETVIDGLTVLSDVNTTNVTSLTSNVGGAGLSVTGDASLATLALSAIDANDTTIVLANNDTTVNLEGTALLTDAASISAVGDATVDVSAAAGGGDAIEAITLQGNGGAVDFAISGTVQSTDMGFTIAGDQAVTISSAGLELKGADITNTGTGGLAIDLTTMLGAAGSLDLTGVTLAGGLDISADVGANTNTIQLDSGTAVSITATQTAASVLKLDANDTATTSSVSIDLSTNDAGDIQTEDFDSVTIATGDKARTIDAVTMGANDATVAIVGTNDITITSASTSGDLTISGKKIDIDGTLDVDGDLKVTGTNDIDMDGAVTADNDITLTATANLDAVVLTSTKNGIEATGDTASFVGTATAKTDITVTATNDVDVDAMTTSTGSIDISGKLIATGGAIAATLGNVTLTASDDGNDSEIDGDVSAGGTITFADGKFDLGGVTANAKSVVISGDTDFVSGTVVAESLTVTSTNDVTVTDIGEKVTGEGVVLSGAAAKGDIDVSTGGAATTGTITLITGEGADTLTLNEDAVHNVQSGDGIDTYTITDVKAKSVINGEGGADIFTVDDDNTVYTVAGGAGDDVFDLDVAAGSTLAVTVDGGDGTADTIKVTGAYGTALDLKNIEEVVMTADTTLTAASLANDSTWELQGAFDLSVITAAGEDETIDLSGATASTLSVPVDLKLIGNSGDDTLTGMLTRANTLIDGVSGTNSLTGGNGIDTIDGGAGIDTINGLDGADIITGNNGADIMNGGAGNDIITGGTGIDTIDGGADDDVITGAAAADVLTGGTGADDFIYLLTADLFTSNTTVDTSLGGGTGTDELKVGTSGTGFSIGGDDVWAGVTSVETITAVANTAAVSVTLDATAYTAGIRTVDLTLADSGNNGGNVIDISEFTGTGATTLTGADGTGTQAITGGAGVDTITGGGGVDTIDGGAGNDIVTLGGGDDIITVSAGSDTITDWVTGDEIIISSGATANVAVAADYTATDADILNSSTAAKAIFTLANGKDFDASAELSTVAGITITAAGNATGSTIKGTDQADIINGSDGADIITGGVGADIIDFGGTDTAADVAIYGAMATNGADVIDNFETTVDHLNVDAAMGTAVTTVEDIAAGGNLASYDDNEVYVYASGDTASAGASSSTITDYTNLTEVATFLSESFLDATTAGVAGGGAATDFDIADTDQNVFVINDLGNDLTYVYGFTADGAGDASGGSAIVAAELVLIGVVTEDAGAALVAADII